MPACDKFIEKELKPWAKSTIENPDVDLINAFEQLGIDYDTGKNVKSTKERVVANPLGNEEREEILIDPDTGEIKKFLSAEDIKMLDEIKREEKFYEDNNLFKTMKELE